MQGRYQNTTYCMATVQGLISFIILDHHSMLLERSSLPQFLPVLVPERSKGPAVLTVLSA